MEPDVGKVKMKAGKELKIFWAMYLIFWLVFGVWDFGFIDSLNEVFDWPFFDPYGLAEMGSNYIALAIAMLILSKKLDDWDVVRPWVIMAVLGQVFALLNILKSNILYKEIKLESVLPAVLLATAIISVGMHIWMKKDKEAQLIAEACGA
jgi:hypothetical protein